MSQNEQCKTARNAARGYLFTDLDMSQDAVSEMIDFKEMTVGSWQAFWSGNDKLDGRLVAYGSNVREVDKFAKIHCGEHTLVETGGAGDEKTHLDNLGVIGFRYILLKYYAGSNTAGTLTAFAVGKKNG